MKKRYCILFLLLLLPLLCACHKHVYEETVVAPTCTEQGYTEYVCVKCGERERDHPVSPPGHENEDVIEDAGCNEHTKTVSTCKVCGAVSVRENEDMGSIHTFEATVQYPDRENQGFTKQSCIYCDTSYLENFTDPVDFSVGLAYTRVGAKYYVSGMGSCTDRDLIIPRVSEMGYQVAGILSRGLNSAVVRSVTVQDGVYDIQTGAFMGCTSLTSITLPALADVGEGAFGSLPKLEELTMPMSHPLAYYFDRSCYQDTYYSVYQSENEIGFTGYLPRSLKRVTALVKVAPYSFSGCTSLTSVSIDKRIDTLPVGIFWNCSSLTQVSYSDSLLSVGSRAFYGCTALGSISLPDTVKSIGSYAFGDTRIKNITLPRDLVLTDEDVGLFEYCSALEEVTFAGDLNRIPPSTFSKCTSLFRIELPDSVTSIGAEAFSDCSKLTYCSMPTSLKSIGGSAFVQTSLLTLELPATLEQMGNFAFRYCKQLTSVDMEKTALIKVPQYAFAGCVQLSSLKLPQKLQIIGVSAFEDTDLGKNPVVLPDTLTSIGGYALKGASLDEFCPKSNVTVGAAAFAESTLKRVVLPEGMTKLEYHTFSGCTQLTEVILPSTLTEIEYSAFEGCTALEEIQIPAGVKILGNQVFYGCTSLKSVSLSASLKQMGYSSFEGCVALEEILLPASLEKVGDNSFRGCTALTDAVFLGERVTLGNRLFLDATSLENLTLPAKLATIPTGLCKGATSLRSLTVPATVTNIYQYAFDGCTALEWVDFSGSAALLQNDCFRNCTALAEVKGEDALPAFDKSNFEGTPLYVEDNGMCIVMGRLLSVDSAQISGSLCVPSYVTYVNTGAFYHCENLEELIFSEGLRFLGRSAFADCYNLKRVVLPDSLESLPVNAVSGVSGLEEIVIGSGMKTMDPEAFSLHYSWLTVTYRGSMEEWRAIEGHDSEALKKRNVICTDGTVVGVIYEENNVGYQVKLTGDGVLTITGTGYVEFYGSYRWSSPTRITKLVIGEGLEGVGGFRGDLFCELINLEEVELPSTLTVLRPSDFAGTPWYESLRGEAGNQLIIGDCLLMVSPLTQGVYEVPEGIKLIGGYAFADCKLLTDIKLPEGLESIGKYAFSGCEGLASIGIPNTVTSIGRDAFARCHALTELTLPASVKSIDDLVSSCDALRSITLLGVTDVGIGIASYCSALETVILNEGIKTLPINTLYDCKALRYVVLPSSLEQIDGSAFWNTPAGAKFLCPNERVFSLMPKVPGLCYVYSEDPPQTPGLWWHYTESGEIEIYS